MQGGREATHGGVGAGSDPGGPCNAAEYGDNNEETYSF